MSNPPRSGPRRGLRRASLLSLTAALCLVGLFVDLVWLHEVGSVSVATRLLDVDLTTIPVLVALTAACVGVRFLRWQYLLRCAGVLVPTRPSLRIYVASLAGILTPVYAGEAIRAVFLRHRFNVPVQASLPVVVLERTLDVAALTLIAFVSSGQGSLRLALGLVLVVLGAGGWLLIRFSPRLGVPPAIAEQLGRPRPLILAALFSLVAWLIPCLLVSAAALGLTVDVAVAESIRIFSVATLAGALSLMPAGVGVTGSAAIPQIHALGVAWVESVAIVVLLRVFSTGMVLATSTPLLFLELRRLTMRKDQRLGHFDAIASSYDGEFAPHVWDYLLDRKVGLMVNALSRSAARSGLGLDLGCGLGRHCVEMDRRGVRVVGVDTAHQLVRKAQYLGAQAVTASALSLPIRDGSVSFVYSVGLFHHLGGPPQWRQACREISRVLPEGGLLVVHETNPRNPLFRFYMAYLFPLLRRIDEGTELWIGPDEWRKISDLYVVDVHYFTFLPDFLPRRVMALLLPLQRRLEASRLQRFSAHYMVVLAKPTPIGEPESDHGTPVSLSTVWSEES